MTTSSKNGIPIFEINESKLEQHCAYPEHPNGYPEQNPQEFGEDLGPRCENEYFKVVLNCPGKYFELDPDYGFRDAFVESKDEMD